MLCFCYINHINLNKKQNILGKYLLNIITYIKKEVYN